MERDEALRADRFARVWSRAGAGGDPGSVHYQLMQAWGQPHRHYHGVDHLRDCLVQLDGAPAAGADRDLAELALWFHDAVYEPLAGDNEARSASWATRALTDAGAPAASADEVGRLVRLTDHARPAGDATGALVSDVDLSILGRDAAEFADYERRIRAEYAALSDPLYRTGRRDVLSRFLARRPLFQTEYFRARYEAPARDNLKRSLAALEGKVAE